MEILYIGIFAAIIIYFIYRRKASKNTTITRNEGENIDDHFHHRRVEKSEELDRILDKINKNGIESLSVKEKDRLKEFSK